MGFYNPYLGDFTSSQRVGSRALRFRVKSPQVTCMFCNLSTMRCINISNHPFGWTFSWCFCWSFRTNPLALTLRFAGFGVAVHELFDLFQFYFNKSKLLTHPIVISLFSGFWVKMAPHFRDPKTKCTLPFTWIGCMGSGSTIRLGFLYFRQGSAVNNKYAEIRVVLAIDCMSPESCHLTRHDFSHGSHGFLQ